MYIENKKYTSSIVQAMKQDFPLAHPGLFVKIFNAEIVNYYGVRRRKGSLRGPRPKFNQIHGKNLPVTTPKEYSEQQLLFLLGGNALSIKEHDNTYISPDIVDLEKHLDSIDIEDYGYCTR